MIPKAYLFDLDGTLIDSLHGLHNALNRAQRQHNIPLTMLETTRPWISYGAKAIVANNCPNTQLHDSLTKAFIEIYQQEVTEGSPLFPEIMSMLQDLNKSHIPWGIVTNKHTHFAKKVIRHHPILATNKVLVCGDTLTQQKPHPAPIFHAAKLLNLSPKSILFVGDSIHDMHASQSAGCTSCLAYYGYIDNPDAKNEWPHQIIVESSLELANIVKAYSQKNQQKMQ